jgi:hypothetical protein
MLYLIKGKSEIQDLIADNEEFISSNFPNR